MNEQTQIFNKTISWKHRVFPANWELVTFNHIIKEARLGGNYKNSDDVTPTPVIKMGNIERGVISVEKLQYLSEDEVFNEEDVLKNGDLLFNTRNTLELVGKVAIWREEMPFAVYNSNLLRLKFDDHFVFSNFYMNYLFNSHYVLSQLKGFATGTTSVAAIYSRDLNKLKLPLPPLPEQQKIAEILSTWDEAIAQTKALIGQLKLRNKGLAQRLLTGKKRLKGFGGEWREVRLGKILKFTKEKAKTDDKFPVYSSSKIGLIKQSDYYGGSNRITQRDIAGFNVIEPGYITYRSRSDDGIFTFNQNKFNQTGVVSKYYPVFIATESSTSFLVDFLNHHSHHIGRFAVGTSQLVLGERDLKNILLKVPPREEQVAISELLNSAQTELRMLEEKLSVTEMQKKGLMQKLLTGEVRVKID